MPKRKRKEDKLAYYLEKVKKLRNKRRIIAPETDSSDDGACAGKNIGTLLKYIVLGILIAVCNRDSCYVVPMFRPSVFTREYDFECWPRVKIKAYACNNGRAHLPPKRYYFSIK